MFIEPSRDIGEEQMAGVKYLTTTKKAIFYAVSLLTMQMDHRENKILHVIDSAHLNRSNIEFTVRGPYPRTFWNQSTTTSHDPSSTPGILEHVLVPHLYSSESWDL